MNHSPAAESCLAPKFLRRRTNFRPGIVAAIFFALAVFASVTGRAQINEFAIPSGNSRPQSIVPGPDGAYWFTEFNNSRIGRIDISNVITEPFISATNTFPYRIIVGPDTNLWFTETAADKIGRISPGTNGAFTNGVLTEFPIHPGINTNSEPGGLAVGPDGNLWFIEFTPNVIGVMDTNGHVLHEYTSGLFSNTTELYNIAAGPDGAMWFTDFSDRSIGRIDQSGNITLLDPPFPLCQPMDIIAGPDGAMWFTEYNSNRIGRITTTNAYPPGRYPAGTNYSDYLMPSLGSSANHFSTLPYRLTIGSDGNIWFTEFGNGNIARIGITATNFVFTGTNNTNFITEYFTPTGGSAPTGITTGPDKNIWFVEYANAVGRFVLPTLNISLTTNSQIVLTWPSTATSYTLQGNTNIGTTNWVNLTSPPPVVIGNLFVYTNAVTNIEIFRLLLTTIP
jgi:virginiamycin B lyase